MAESTTPEIDVAELMQRVREEAVIRSRQRGNGHPPRYAKRPALPVIGQTEIPPVIGLSQPLDDKKLRVETALQKARRMLEVPSWIPRFLRSLFRRQGGYNRALLETVTHLAKTNQQLNRRVQELAIVAQQQNDWLRSVAAHQQMESNWIRAATPIVAESPAAQQSISQFTADLQVQTARSSELIDAMRARLDGDGEHLRNLQGEAERGVQNIRAVHQIVAQLEEKHSALLQQWLTIGGADLGQRCDALHEGLRAEAAAREQAERKIEAQHSQLDQLGQRCVALQEGLGAEATAREQAEHRIEAQHSQSDHLGQRCAALHESLMAEAAAREQAERMIEAQHPRLDLIGQRLDLNQAILTRLDERQVSDSAYLRRELQLRTSALPPQKDTTTCGSSEEPPLPSRNQFDAFYLAFEDHFRGNRTLIKERVGIYLPLVGKTGAGTAEYPVLDLGCGRGEWLELLKESGFIARGLDLNEFMVSECQERGLDVVQADVLEHLRSLPDGSLGMITGMHIIEHLPFPALMELLALSLRVLRPGGMIVFETPNPANVQVGSNRFYTDPTHLHPLPQEFIRFVASTAGFSEVEITPLHPDANALRLSDDAGALDRVVNEMFFGFQDYAVTGRR